MFLALRCARTPPLYRVGMKSTKPQQSANQQPGSDSTLSAIDGIVSESKLPNDVDGAVANVSQQESLTPNLLNGKQTPKIGGCSSGPVPVSPNQVKFLECKLIPIASIEYQKSAVGHSELIVQMVASLTTPWGRQLQPVIVQKNKPGHAKEWRLLDGLVRVLAAESAGWTHVLAVIFEGSDDGARFAVAEANFVRNHINRYQLRKLASEWKNLWQALHHEHTHGGDKSKQAEVKTGNGLPTFEKVIESGGAGMKKSTFYRLVADYEGGSTSKSKVYGLEPTIIRPWLDAHPSAGLCRKDSWLNRLTLPTSSFCFLPSRRFDLNPRR